MPRSYVLRIGAGFVGGAVLVGLGAVFFWAGLDDADKIASVLGLFIGIGGLVATVYSVMLARRGRLEISDNLQSAPGPAPASVPSVTIGGDNAAPIVIGDNNQVRP